MPLNLIKLCVGVEDIEQLRAFQSARAEAMRAAGLEPRQAHVTRMTPRRRDELLDGGSLYWVIRGRIQVRQKLLDVDPFTDDDGIKRCRLVLSPKLIVVRPQPRRAFQGWRYFDGEDAPDDIGPVGEGDDDPIPAAMRAELTEMGLI